MTNPSPRTGSGRDHDDGVDRESAPGLPGWVKVTGIVVAILAILIAVVLLTGLGGGHGPGRHMGSSSAAEETVSIQRS